MDTVQMMDSCVPLKISPLHPKLGVEVRGVDLRGRLDAELRSEIRRLLVEHKVLCFRDQPLTRDQHRAFALCFGELQRALPPVDGYCDITAIYYGPDHPPLGTNYWHSDWSAAETPPIAIVLKALQVPAVGGDTLFADMIAAYQGLPAEIKTRIEKLSALHDMENYYGKIALEQDSKDDPYRKMSCVHPVVRTHPESGEKILYVNSLFTQRILGMDEGESEELLRYLCSQAAVPEYQLRLAWRANSVVLWDNRSTQHYASADYWPAERRLEAVAIVGDRPY